MGNLPQKPVVSITLSLTTSISEISFPTTLILQPRPQMQSPVSSEWGFPLTQDVMKQELAWDFVSVAWMSQVKRPTKEKSQQLGTCVLNAVPSIVNFRLSVGDVVSPLSALLIWQEAITTFFQCLLSRSCLATMCQETSQGALDAVRFSQVPKIDEFTAAHRVIRYSVGNVIFSSMKLFTLVLAVQLNLVQVSINTPMEMVMVTVPLSMELVSI